MRATPPVGAGGLVVGSHGPRAASGGTAPRDEASPADALGADPFRRRKRRMLRTARGAIITSTLSTLVVIGGIVAAFVLAPGSRQVRSVYFDVHDMWQAFLGDPHAGFYSVGKGLVINIEMFMIGEVLILGLALVIALIRLSRSPLLFPLRMIAVAYVDFFRGVPLILVILAIGFGLPALYLPFVSSQSAFVYGVLALVLSYSAYVSEVYRAGFNSVPHSQVASARSLGLRPRTAMRYVVLPQAVRTIIPPLLNTFVSLQKDTALVAVLGAVIEANRAAEIYSSTVFNYSGYTVAAILFLLLTIPLARFTDHLIARDRARRLAGVP
ncbi:MAG: amino acid ABC transporter permease [Actinomycetota bacterium]|nr:amino acid ABC transporter permease [Actinomycetota bacterium]